MSCLIARPLLRNLSNLKLLILEVEPVFDHQVSLGPRQIWHLKQGQRGHARGLIRISQAVLYFDDRYFVEAAVVCTSLLAKI